MIFDTENNITIITRVKVTIVEFKNKLVALYDGYKNTNVIINLSNVDDLSLQDVINFLPISNKHRKGNFSFVIVNPSIAISEIPDEIIVVPTLQEAHDIIEMEQIERDLGI